ncbi:MAG: 4-hydroxyphenylacetate 3-hydroxylase family protein [Proteobacteria bacterium]|nr:4-hydroxyphenylacetate 3-hydroxylase family protein [Pseudomonadota bacterium]MBS0572972.1 4-hydroxyphenylacetate 3-hydroxylase family protein [Pseudomonadota bacterium]
MIRTGDEYRESIRDGRRVFVNGEQLGDVASHPQFRPIVDLRARIHDMAHEAATREVMTVARNGEVSPVANVLPLSQADWWAKRRAADLVMDEAGGAVTRVGDETVGEIWSLHDCAAALNAIDPQFGPNIAAHVDRILRGDRFLISANTDPKGDRSRPPQDQDPDMILHVVRETDAGLIVRGAKFETAAAYANLAFTKPAIADWGGAEQSDHAVGFICDLGAPGLRIICRNGFAGRAPAEDYPLSSRLDETDTIVVFDDVFVPWENVLFHRHTRSAMAMRAVLHRYTAFAFVQRSLRFADLMIGAALFNVRQTGLDGQQAVQEKLADLAVWREGIHAHLTAAIALAERSPAGLMMPNQSLLYAGRVLAGTQMHKMMHLARELCGGQIALVPDAAAFRDPETGPWLAKYFAVGDEWQAEDRRRLLAFARDLLNSDHAGHRLTFQLFAQSPPHTHLAAVYRNFDWDGPLALVRAAAGLSEKASGAAARRCRDSAVSRWFATTLPDNIPETVASLSPGI